MNKVILVGRLSEEVDVKYQPGGSPVTEFTLITKEKWKDREENFEHTIKAYGHLASLAQTFEKNDLLCVEGKLRTTKWTGRKGEAHSQTFIVASQLLHFYREESPPEF